MGEIWVREEIGEIRGGDVGEIQARYGRDIREMYARYSGRLVAEVLEYRKERQAHRHLLGLGVAVRGRGIAVRVRVRHSHLRVLAPAQFGQCSFTNY